MHSIQCCASQTPKSNFIGHMKLTLGWVLIPVNFDPIQEIGQKVGGGRSFARLYSIITSTYILS